MKTLAAGLTVRFFKVITNTGLDLTGDVSRSALIES